MLDLAVVILNYNTRDLLRECLRTAYASQGAISFDVCVVDNASSDGSAAMVRTEFPQAVLLASDRNGGFSYGNNLGLHHYGFSDQPSSTDPAGTPRYALLLNPDTEVPPTAFADMVACLLYTSRCV